MKKILLITGLLLLLTQGNGPIHEQVYAEEPAADCNWQFSDVLEKEIKPLKAKFEEKMEPLTKKPDTPPAQLIEVGVFNLRKYHRDLKDICQKTLACNKELKLADPANANYAMCGLAIENEVSLQKAVFGENMITDANKKKMVFWVNKYKDLNKKFRGLIEKLTFIQGELLNLLAAVNKVTKTQTP